MQLYEELACAELSIDLGLFEIRQFFSAIHSNGLL